MAYKIKKAAKAKGKSKSKASKKSSKSGKKSSRAADQSVANIERRAAASKPSATSRSVAALLSFDSDTDNSSAGGGKKGMFRRRRRVPSPSPAASGSKTGGDGGRSKSGGSGSHKSAIVPHKSSSTTTRTTTNGVGKGKKHKKNSKTSSKKSSKSASRNNSPAAPATPPRSVARPLPATPTSTTATHTYGPSDSTGPTPAAVAAATAAATAAGRSRSHAHSAYTTSPQLNRKFGATSRPVSRPPRLIAKQSAEIQEKDKVLNACVKADANNSVYKSEMLAVAVGGERLSVVERPERYNGRSSPRDLVANAANPSVPVNPYIACLRYCVERPLHARQVSTVSSHARASSSALASTYFHVYDRHFTQGSLRKYISKNRGTKFPVTERLDVAVDIARALVYLHSRGTLTPASVSSEDEEGDEGGGGGSGSGSGDVDGSGSGSGSGGGGGGGGGYSSGIELGSGAESVTSDSTVDDVSDVSGEGGRGGRRRGRGAGKRSASPPSDDSGYDTFGLTADEYSVSGSGGGGGGSGGESGGESDSDEADCVHGDVTSANVGLIRTDRRLTAVLLDVSVDSEGGGGGYGGGGGGGYGGGGGGGTRANRSMSASISISAAYPAPELLHGSPSRATDIFFLGIVLLELVTGRMPEHKGTSLFDKFFDHSTEKGKTKARKLIDGKAGWENGRLADDVIDLVRRCTAKTSRSARPSAQDVLDELLDIRAAALVSAAESAHGDGDEELCGICLDPVDTADEDYAYCTGEPLHAFHSECASSYISQTLQNMAKLRQVNFRLQCPSCDFQLSQVSLRCVEPGVQVEFAAFVLRAAGSIQEQLHTLELEQQSGEGRGSSYGAVVSRERRYSDANNNNNNNSHGSVAVGDSGGGGGDFDLDAASTQLRELLNFVCPRCHKAILHEEGCAALECGLCGCYICGVCLINTVTDAHKHVFDVHGAVYVEQEVIDDGNLEWRLGRVRRFLAGIRSAEDREALLEAVADDLAAVDIGLSDVEISDSASGSASGSGSASETEDSATEDSGSGSGSGSEDDVGSVETSDEEGEGGGYSDSDSAVAAARRRQTAKQTAAAFVVSIVTLQCPACGVPYVGYGESALLTCQRCSKHFCAVCDSIKPTRAALKKHTAREHGGSEFTYSDIRSERKAARIAQLASYFNAEFDRDDEDDVDLLNDVLEFTSQFFLPEIEVDEILEWSAPTSETEESGSESEVGEGESESASESEGGEGESGSGSGSVEFSSTADESEDGEESSSVAYS